MDPDSPEPGGEPTPPDPSAPPDLSRFLKDWAYEAGKLNVRLITGDDGEPKIQMRLDLGILQMQVDGRPDGQRPRGYESLLEFHEARLDEHVAEHGSASGYVLTGESCRELKEEAAQYYRRYTALWALNDFDGVVRDTSWNLRVLDLLGKFAENEADRRDLEPFRPYITMMRARALAAQALKDHEPKAAIHAIDEGLDALRQQFATADQPDAFDQSSEVQLLRTMRDQLIPKLPLSPKAELTRRLQTALAAENYELAAILRDELKSMGE